MPTSLRERVLVGLREAGSGKREAEGEGAPLPDTLQAAGERLLAVARSGPASRETALALLAADALMTFACEAMAEAAPERLGEMT